MGLRIYGKHDKKALMWLCSQTGLVRRNGKSPVLRAIKEIVKGKHFIAIGTDPMKNLVVLQLIADNTAMVHIVIHEKFRGSDAVKLCRDIGKFMYRKGIRMAYAIAEDKKSALMAAMVGMKRIGQSPDGSIIYAGETKWVL